MHMDANEVEIIPNEALKSARESREAKLAEFEARRIARSLIIPVDDNDVQAALRKRSQPICYFGEDASDRRERLRDLMGAEVLEKKSAQNEDVISKAMEIDESNDAAADDEPSLDRAGKGNAEEMNRKDGDNDENTVQREEFFTEGTTELKALRHSLAMPSLKRARARLIEERRAVGDSEEAVATRLKARQTEEAAVTRVREARIIASHIGDERPMSAIAYASGSEVDKAIVATGSWGGTVKIWGGDMCGDVLQTLDAHAGRISMVRLCHKSDDADDIRLLTCGADGLARVYKRERSNCIDNSDYQQQPEAEQKQREEKQHEQQGFKEVLKIDAHGGARVSDVNMHPFRQSVVATAGFDGNVGLHDGEVTILRQETGHARVYRVGFHPDGSLLSTCGLDGGVRVWDLRSGRAVMTMTTAHADDVLGIEFRHDGRVLASCGADNVVRIWDLRSVKCVKTVAAHRGLVSGMKFAGDGDVLITCSFDSTVKCWGTKRNWGLLNAHAGFEDKVTAVDCSENADFVVAACYDKTWKLMGKDE